MGWISSPIGVGIVWCNDLQPAARFRDAVQLGDEPEYIRNMLDDVATNDLFEFIVSEWIRKHSQIMNHICMTQTIRIDPDRAGKFVLTTTDIKDLFLR